MITSRRIDHASQIRAVERMRCVIWFTYALSKCGINLGFDVRFGSEAYIVAKVLRLANVLIWGRT
jgi:hypothetical protein